jgi:hypothetical protein
VIALPPSEAGADQLNVAEASPGESATLVGAPGAVAGVTDAPDAAGPVPTALVAETEKAYEMPFVRPEIVQASGPVFQVHVLPPGAADAV